MNLIENPEAEVYLKDAPVPRADYLYYQDVQIITADICDQLGEPVERCLEAFGIKTPCNRGNLHDVYLSVYEGQTPDTVVLTRNGNCAHSFWEQSAASIVLDFACDLKGDPIPLGLSYRQLLEEVRHEGSVMEMNVLTWLWFILTGETRMSIAELRQAILTSTLPLATSPFSTTEFLNMSARCLPMVDGMNAYSLSKLVRTVYCIICEWIFKHQASDLFSVKDGGTNAHLENQPSEKFYAPSEGANSIFVRDMRGSDFVEMCLLYANPYMIVNWDLGQFVPPWRPGRESDSVAHKCHRWMYQFRVPKCARVGWVAIEANGTFDEHYKSAVTLEDPAGSRFLGFVACAIEEPEADSTNSSPLVYPCVMLRGSGHSQRVMDAIQTYSNNMAILCRLGQSRNSVVKIAASCYKSNVKMARIFERLLRDERRQEKKCKRTNAERWVYERSEKKVVQVGDSKCTKLPVYPHILDIKLTCQACLIRNADGSKWRSTAWVDRVIQNNQLTFVPGAHTPDITSSYFKVDTHGPQSICFCIPEPQYSAPCLRIPRESTQQDFHWTFTFYMPTTASGGILGRAGTVSAKFDVPFPFARKPTVRAEWHEVSDRIAVVDIEFTVQEDKTKSYDDPTLTFLFTPEGEREGESFLDLHIQPFHEEEGIDRAEMLSALNARIASGSAAPGRVPTLGKFEDDDNGNVLSIYPLQTGPARGLAQTAFVDQESYNLGQVLYVGEYFRDVPDWYLQGSFNLSIGFRPSKGVDQSQWPPRNWEWGLVEATPGTQPIGIAASHSKQVTAVPEQVATCLGDDGVRSKAMAGSQLFFWYRFRGELPAWVRSVSKPATMNATLHWQSPVGMEMEPQFIGWTYPKVAKKRRRRPHQQAA